MSDYDNVCVDCIVDECEIHEAKIVGEELYNRVVNEMRRIRPRNTIWQFIEEQMEEEDNRKMEDSRVF